MDLNAFKRCFEELCLAFDIDFEKKNDRMGTYYDSKLGEITEYTLMDLIKHAKQELNVKYNSLPSIRDLVNLYYSCNIIEFQTTRKREESFHDGDFARCNGTGWVSEDRGKDGFWTKGACKCIIGQQKQRYTKLGQQIGFYDGSKSANPVPF